MVKEVVEGVLITIVCVVNLRFLHDAFTAWASPEGWKFFVWAALPLLALLTAVSLSLLRGLDKAGFPRIYHGALVWPLLGIPVSLLVIGKILTPVALALPALIGLGLSGLGIAQDWRDWRRWRKASLLLNVIWAAWGCWLFSLLRL